MRNFDYTELLGKFVKLDDLELVPDPKYQDGISLSDIYTAFALGGLLQNPAHNGLNWDEIVSIAEQGAQEVLWRRDGGTEDDLPQSMMDAEAFIRNAVEAMRTRLKSKDYPTLRVVASPEEKK